LHHGSQLANTLQNVTGYHEMIVPRLYPTANPIGFV